MLSCASSTLLKVLVSTAMCGLVGDALRTPQASLAGELHGDATRPLRQGLLTCGSRRHDEAVKELEMSQTA